MPTVQTLPFIKPHFHDNAGNPATGCRLYSYDATTNDEIPLYKDAAGSIEYTNPIILNSRGEPDGMSIYLDVDKVYKIILRNQNDSEIWTVNSVIGVGGSTGSATNIINLPAHSVLGNAGSAYGQAYAVDIVDNIDLTTDINLVPSVGAVTAKIDEAIADIVIPPGVDGKSVYMQVISDGNVRIYDDYGNETIITSGTDGTDGTDGVGLVEIKIDNTSDTATVLYKLTSGPAWYSAGDILPEGIGKVKTSSNDTSVDYLNAKIIGTTDAITVTNVNEQLVVDIDDAIINRLESAELAIDDLDTRVTAIESYSLLRKLTYIGGTAGSTSVSFPHTLGTSNYTFSIVDTVSGQSIVLNVIPTDTHVTINDMEPLSISNQIKITLIG